MPAPRKFDEETRARAVRLYQDRLRDHGESMLAARRHVGRLLDIKPATLRNWIEAEERVTAPSGVGGDDSSIWSRCGGCARRSRSCAGRMRS
jgi:transposase